MFCFEKGIRKIRGTPATCAPMKVHALILAGGKGTRLDSSTPKQFIPVFGKPLLIHALEQFELCDSVDDITVIVPSKAERSTERIVAEAGFLKVKHFFEGGMTRQESSYRGIMNLSQLYELSDIVLIHDGARPCIDRTLIEEIIKASQLHGACTAASEVTETLASVKSGKIDHFIPRTNVYNVKTPQGFILQNILLAHKKALTDKIVNATDDASLALQAGFKVAVIRSSPANIKVTTGADLEIIEKYIK